MWIWYVSGHVGSERPVLVSSVPSWTIAAFLLILLRWYVRWPPWDGPPMSWWQWWAPVALVTGQDRWQGPVSTLTHHHWRAERGVSRLWPGPGPGTPWYCQWHPQCAQHLYTHHTCVSTVWQSSVILSDNTTNIYNTVNFFIIKWSLSVIPSSITASNWRCTGRDLPHLHVSCLQHCLGKFCP